jgi:predicted RNA-binding Zn ribbon-like protein
MPEANATDDRPAPLFVGDHPAIDFLNTQATPAGKAIEWLGDGADLVAWLERAGAIELAVAAKFRRARERDRLDDIAGEARSLRAWLRGFIARHAGRTLDAAAAELAPLNRLLARDDSYEQIETGSAGSALRPRRVRRWAQPAALLQPIAASIGDLVCHADFRLIRACEGADCTLLFLDRTKAHARRWCSMALCGNRAKQAAHRDRRKHLR